MRKYYKLDCLKDSDITYSSNILAELNDNTEITFTFQAPYRKTTIKVSDLKEILKDT